MASPLGLLLGYGIAALAIGAYQWDIIRYPLVVSGHTYAYAILVVVLAATTSGLVVRRRLERLDLVAVLKTRE